MVWIVYFNFSVQNVCSYNFFTLFQIDVMILRRCLRDEVGNDLFSCLNFNNGIPIV